MATIRHFQGIDYTLTLKTRMNTRGYDRSTLEAKDLTGRVFEICIVDTNCGDTQFTEPLEALLKSRRFTTQSM
jgi:hypothetical protein